MRVRRLCQIALGGASQLVSSVPTNGSRASNGHRLQQLVDWLVSDRLPMIRRFEHALQPTTPYAGVTADGTQLLFSVRQPNFRYRLDGN